MRVGRHKPHPFELAAELPCKHSGFANPLHRKTQAHPAGKPQSIKPCPQNILQCGAFFAQRRPPGRILRRLSCANREIRRIGRRKIKRARTEKRFYVSKIPLHHPQIIGSVLLGRALQALAKNRIALQRRHTLWFIARQKGNRQNSLPRAEVQAPIPRPHPAEVRQQHRIGCCAKGLSALYQNRLPMKAANAFIRLEHSFSP